MSSNNIDKENVKKVNKLPKNISKMSKKSKKSFKFGSVLGEGAYAIVQHAVLRNNPSEEFAVKIMDKQFIKKMVVTI